MREPRRKPSRTSKRRSGLLASLAVAGIAGGGSVAHADTSTTLTGLGTTNEPVPVNHGSNAEATVTWHPDWDQFADWDGRGNVYQVDRRVLDIVFEPSSPQIAITINSFQLDEWAGGGDTTAAWSVMGSSSGLLASGVFVAKNTANDPNDAGGRTLISPAATGIAGETLTLLFDHSASAGFISYLAIDNLVFSTAIPEPSTGVLGIVGLGALAMRRKRSRPA